VAGRVAVPTLAISAMDDPVCSSVGIDPTLFDNNPNLVLASTERGSHLAFYQGFTAVPWVDEAVVQWLDAALNHADSEAVCDI
jgi:predicted alpha/beta-fold hydrolase